MIRRNWTYLAGGAVLVLSIAGCGHSTVGGAASAPASSDSAAVAYVNEINPDVEAVEKATGEILSDGINNSTPIEDFLILETDLQNLKTDLPAITPPEGLRVPAARLAAAAAGFLDVVNTVQPMPGVPVMDGAGATVLFSNTASSFASTLTPIYAAAGLPVPTAPAGSSSEASSLSTTTPSYAPVAVTSTEPVGPGASGCPAGSTISSMTSGGYAYRIVQADEFDAYVCVTTPGGTTTHLAKSATDVSPFSGASYFEVDGLGHVFVNYEPGQIPGVLVVVPGDPVRYIQVANASVVQASPAFTLDIETNTCMPDCADGSYTHSAETWDPDLGTYVQH